MTSHPNTIPILSTPTGVARRSLSRRRLLQATLAIAGTGLMAACGGGDSTPSSSGDGTAPTATGVAAAETPEAPKGSPNQRFGGNCRHAFRSPGRVTPAADRQPGSSRDLGCRGTGADRRPACL